MGGAVLLVIFLAALSDDEKELVDRIFEEHNVLFYNISLNILHSQAEAEEAVSQAFLKIIENIEKISKLPSPQIAPYCVIMVKNESITLIRKQKSATNLEPFEELADDELIEDDFCKNADHEQLLKAIASLSDEEKYFINLRFTNNMKIKDIAKLVGISEEATKKRGQRIIKKLQCLYEKDGENINYV